MTPRLAANLAATLLLAPLLVPLAVLDKVRPLRLPAPFDGPTA